MAEQAPERPLLGRCIGCFHRFETGPCGGCGADLPHGFCGWGDWHGAHVDTADNGEEYRCMGFRPSGNHERCPLCRTDLMRRYEPYG